MEKMKEKELLEYVLNGYTIDVSDEFVEHWSTHANQLTDEDRAGLVMVEAAREEPNSERRYWINADPVPQGRPRFGNGHAYEDRKSRDFKRFVSAVVGMRKEDPLEGPLCVTLKFHVARPKTVTRDYPTVRPDIDNYAKAILDACNGIVWDDDAQIVELRLSKRYADGRDTGIDILVQEID